ncbi:uncharacterized protein N7487_003653 [Penicillium crustosum]|uniref:uncharacterized protein n=1 Tax=Penicillium crustosum TaxID=36656 RepID=UPI002391CC74|nr:uncharacterized protein N7487_003653 [Penicillium crustosum]KAJ5409294.1 hypothetical protein N7487_003653 [Penicillium crustosum]
MTIHFSQTSIQSTIHPSTLLSTLESIVQPSNQSTILSIQSTASSLTVAGFGFRTIGRLVKQPLRATTSSTHFDRPLKPTHRTNNIHQSDRGGLRLQDNRLTVAGFRASGQSADWWQPLLPTIQLDHPSQLPTSITHLNYPPQLPTSMDNIRQSDRGGHRLQDNRQTGQQSTLTIHFNLNKHPRSHTRPLQSRIHFKQTSTIDHPY